MDLFPARIVREECFIVVGFVKTFKILKGKRKFFKKLLLKMDFFRRQIIERLVTTSLVVELKIFI